MRLLTGLALSAALFTVATAGPGIETLQGTYELWEDFEGGKVCDVVLETERTIGGYVVRGDNRCMKAFKFSGEPHAWFIDREGWATIVDASRKILVRLKPGEDGSFHANRSAHRLENLNLTRK